VNVLEKIKNTLDSVKKVYALDVEITAGDSLQCRVVELTKRDGAIHFSQLEIGGDSLDAVCEKIPGQSPVCLLLNGKGIIYRKLAVSETVSEPDLIKTIIPNAKPEEFYLQQYTVAVQNDKRTKLLALARKSPVDKILAEFTAKFDFVVDVSISPFEMDNLLPVLAENEIFYKNFLLEIKQQKIVDFSAVTPETQTIHIGGNTIDADLLPALALGFTFLLDYKKMNTPISDINERRKEYIYKQKIKLTGKLSLIALFVLLLVNFLVFDHFYKQVQAEQQSVANREETIDKLKTLKEEFASKNRFLQQSGLLEQNRVAFYLDKLAATIPRDIALTDLQINPLANPNKKENVELINNLIRISGTSNKTSSFNDWIKILKTDTAFTNVAIIAYEYDLKTNIAVFTVELGY
jgi:Tfp pilus assembly protein PilN